MKKLIQHNAGNKNILILAILVILFNIAMGFAFGRIEGEILDTRIYYTPDEAYKSISGYGDEGRSLYVQTTLLLDYLYPWIYSLLLSIVLFRLSGKHRISLLPFFILVLDYAENTAILIMLTRYPARFDLLASTAGIATFSKWLMVIIIFLMILALGGTRVFDTLRKRNP